MAPRITPGVSVLLAALFVGTASGPVAFSQPPPPGGPGGPGMGRRPMGGPRPSTAAQAPVAALAAGLKLTDAQKTQIQAIQDQLRQQRDALMPRPGPGNDAPPDPETMRANFDRMRTLEQKANTDISAVLTDRQKTALPGLLKQLDTLREAGIPAALYGDLKLTDDQQKQIDAIVKKVHASMQPPSGGGQPGGGGPGGGRGAMGQARQKMHEQAMAVLNSDQQKAVQEYIDAHPRPPFGGPGGPGGGFPPPPGGDGGPPPPPPDGDGGPPPPPPGGDEGTPPPPPPGE